MEYENIDWFETILRHSVREKDNDREYIFVDSVCDLAQILCHPGSTRATTTTGEKTNLPLSRYDFIVMCKALKAFRKNQNIEGIDASILTIQTQLNWILGCNVGIHKGDFDIEIIIFAPTRTIIRFNDSLLYEFADIATLYER